MTKWYIQDHSSISLLKDYFDFNGLSYTSVDLWNSEHQDYVVSDELLNSTKSVLVITAHVLRYIVRNCEQQDRLVKYINQYNYVWLWDTSDGFTQVLTGEAEMRQINRRIEFANLWIFVDGLPVRNHWSRDLARVKFLEFPLNKFVRMPRVSQGIVDKISPSRDFLLTMVRKTDRHHREVLWQELQRRPGLIDRGHVNYHDRKQPWIGEGPRHHSWADGHPSMDLYRDSWFEIVPETLCQDGYFITEKTIKPMAVCTPFLMISTPGYLQFLRNCGFETFHDMVDESYDRVDNLQDRVRMIVDRAEHIVKHGANAFYWACRDRLDHNYQMLAELTGSWDHRLDRAISHWISQVDQ